jgi:hypothetical protein
MEDKLICTKVNPQSTHISFYGHGGRATLLTVYFPDFSGNFFPEQRRHFSFRLCRTWPITRSPSIASWSPARTPSPASERSPWTPRWDVRQSLACMWKTTRIIRSSLWSSRTRTGRRMVRLRRCRPRTMLSTLRRSTSTWAKSHRLTT